MHRGLHPATLVLGTAPGGIAEMCITAKVLQLGVPLVTAFHVTRVVVILLTTVPVFARVAAVVEAPAKAAEVDAKETRMSMPWDPAQYLAVRRRSGCGPRSTCSRAFRSSAPRTIVDLGCGAGNVTRLLARALAATRRSSASTVRRRCSAKRARRRATMPRCTFVAADLAQWAPDAPVDLVYSNAALHWLPDHAALFARVAAMVAPDGVLAVQMPDNFRAPSHTAIADIARSPRWRGAAGRASCASRRSRRAADYFAWLAPLHGDGRHLDDRVPAGAAERREDGEHPVAAWTKGTWLVPFLEALDDGEQRRIPAPTTCAAARSPIRRGPTGARCSRSGACSSSPRGRTGKAA